MSSLLNTLKSLKDKLIGTKSTDDTNKINSSDNNLNTDKNKVDNKAVLDETLKLFKETQNNKVTINAGGKLYSTTKSTLTNCGLKTIFLEEIQKSVDNNSKNNNIEIFYDGNPHLFKHIMNIIRHFNSESKDSKFDILINNIEDEVVLKEMLCDIFIKIENENDILSKVKIEREVKITRPVTTTQPTVDINANNANYDYNNNNANAAYNYNY